MSKYQPLWDYLNNNKNFPIKLTFDNIKDILGFELDHSFLKYKKELNEFEFKVEKISLKDRYIIFNK